MKNTLPKKPKTYSPDDIRKAAQMYAVYGNLTKVFKQTGIPVTTLFYWRDNKVEWGTRHEEVRNEKMEELNAHFTAILERSMEELEDRIQHGDEFYDAKEGKYYRKKVSARDLAIIAGVAFDKRQLLNNQPTSVRGTVSAEERLKELSKIMLKGKEKTPVDLFAVKKNSQQ